MISGTNYKRVDINIITYKSNIAKIMNEERTFDRRNYKNNQNRFICSICLNQKHSKENNNTECYKRQSRSCPICQNSYEIDNDSDLIQNNHKGNQNKYEYQTEKHLEEHKDKNGKNIQTSQPDVTQGLTLLNEVLTVFQSRKNMENKKDKLNKTIIFKDACVNTNDIKKGTPKLSLSKIFYCSIEENKQMCDKFVIVNCQPEANKVSQFSIDLMNRKSSSIPQMKLEELKNSLKEKTKSKDAIEEVNRMFATVRKYEINENSEAPNRPMIRSGPRVLPVVKTTVDKTENIDKPTQNFRCCQTNYRMSSGDSFECFHRTNDRCEKCFYMMCCYHQRSSNSGNACPHCHKNCEHTKNPNINV